jgi:polar amino acid transport system substrate-binding protein
MEKLMRTNRLLPLLVAAISLATLAPASAGTLQQVLSRGSLRVGITLAPPWAIRDEAGEYVGFEVDIARKLAADMDVAVEFLRYEYDALIRALEAGEIDLIAAGLTITPDRALHVNFSRPYATSGVGIATNLESTADVGRLEELNDPQFTIAAMAGSVAEDLVERIMPRAQLQTFRLPEAAVEALIAGEVDAYLDEEPIPSFLALEYPRQVDVPVNRPLLETRSAFAVTKDDPNFVFFLNAWIEAREADTWLPTTYQYWFKTLQWRD